MSDAEAAATMRQLVAGELAGRPLEQRPLVSDVSCVAEASRRWSCAVKLTIGGGSSSLPFALICDETGACIASRR